MPTTSAWNQNTNGGLSMNAKTKAAVIKHGENLLAIFPQANEQDPEKLCKRLRAQERRGEALGVRLCKGPEFPGEDDADKISDAILSKVNTLLANRPCDTESPVPIFINRDPRGYAIKIPDSWMRTYHVQLHHDLGGYGIIAPDLTVE